MSSFSKPVLRVHPSPSSEVAPHSHSADGDDDEATPVAVPGQAHHFPPHFLPSINAATTHNISAVSDSALAKHSMATIPTSATIEVTNASSKALATTRSGSRHSVTIGPTPDSTKRPLYSNNNSGPLRTVHMSEHARSPPAQASLLDSHHVNNGLSDRRRSSSRRPSLFQRVFQRDADDMYVDEDDDETLERSGTKTRALSFLTAASSTFTRNAFANSGNVPGGQSNTQMPQGWTSPGSNSGSQSSLAPVLPLKQLPLWPPVHPDTPMIEIIRIRTHKIMTKASGSQAAVIFNYFFLAIIVASICLMIAESLQSISSNPSAYHLLFWCEFGSTVFFSIEFLVRFATWPRDAYRQFFKSILNWTDLMALMPFWTQFVLTMTKEADEEAAFNLDGWRVVQVFRVFRLFKVIRMSTQLRLAYRAFRKSRDGILMLLFLFGLALTFFSSLMYVAESQVCELNPATGLLVYKKEMEMAGMRCSFQSILDGMWWCIVTITTTGYGDFVPRSVYGKLVGGCTMLVAVGLFSFPISIFSQSLAEVYREHRQHKATMEAVAQRLRDAREKKRQRDASIYAAAHSTSAGADTSTSGGDTGGAVTPAMQPLGPPLALSGTVRELTASLRNLETEQAVTRQLEAVLGPGHHPHADAFVEQLDATQYILEQCFERCSNELASVQKAVEDLTGLLSELKTVSTRQLTQARTAHDKSIAQIKSLRRELAAANGTSLGGGAGGAGGGMGSMVFGASIFGNSGTASAAVSREPSAMNVSNLGNMLSVGLGAASRRRSMSAIASTGSNANLGGALPGGAPVGGSTASQRQMQGSSTSVQQQQQTLGPPGIAPVVVVGHGRTGSSTSVAGKQGQNRAPPDLFIG